MGVLREMGYFTSGWTTVIPDLIPSRGSAITSRMKNEAFAGDLMRLRQALAAGHPSGQCL